MSNVEGKIVKNFTLEEMANNLTTDSVKLVLTPEVVRQANMMQELRDWYGEPMKVNSWYRTKEFNKKKNGDVHSCHLDGIATDIAFTSISSLNRGKFIVKWRQICEKYGVIGGVSIYIWGLHFDSNATPTRYGKENHNFRITDFRK